MVEKSSLNDVPMKYSSFHKGFDVGIVLAVMVIFQFEDHNSEEHPVECKWLFVPG